MRFVICWEQIAGYIGAGWRELARQPGVELLVLAGRGGTCDPNAPYDDDVAGGVPCRLLDRSTLRDPGVIRKEVLSFAPDVVYLSGWSNPAYVKLVYEPRLRPARFVMGMDNPREDTWRQLLGRFRVGRFLRRMDRVIVAGERSWQFAHHLLRVPEHKLSRGLYSIDFDAFATAADIRRQSDRWPKRFAFVGRYEHTKGLDVLLEAYAAYRRVVNDSWPLACFGKGSLGRLVDLAEGVENRGFVQPRDLPAALGETGAFVLPSRREPWGAVIAEAGAAGLPIVCTESCGAAVDVVRSMYNGMIIPTGHVEALTDSLLWLHNSGNQLPEMGRRSQQLAEPFSARHWAVRWAYMLRELTQLRRAA